MRESFYTNSKYTWYDTDGIVHRVQKFEKFGYLQSCYKVTRYVNYLYNSNEDYTIFISDLKLKECFYTEKEYRKIKLESLILT